MNQVNWESVTDVSEKYAASIFVAIRQMQLDPPKRDIPIGLHQQPFISQVTNNHKVYMQIVQDYTHNPG